MIPQLTNQDRLVLKNAFPMNADLADFFEQGAVACSGANWREMNDTGDTHNPNHSTSMLRSSGSLIALNRIES